MGNQIVTNPDHGDRLIRIAEGNATVDFQVFLDDLVLRLNGNLLGAAVRLTSYEAASLPPPASWTGSIIYVSNESGGPVTAFSDGTNWRRTTDRAIVS